MHSLGSVSGLRVYGLGNPNLRLLIPIDDLQNPTRGHYLSPGNVGALNPKPFTVDHCKRVVQKSESFGMTAGKGGESYS